MGKKRQKLSEYTTKTLSEIKELADNAYIPLFTKNTVNNKENINNIGEKLTPGTNIQIDENDNITATDTVYIADKNISIINNTISYIGAQPNTYAATGGLKISNAKLSTNINGTLGSKLNPVTFSNNYTLISAGNTMDSILVTRRHQFGQVPKPYFFITKNAFVVTDGEAPVYYYKNTETGDRRWEALGSAPAGYELIKPTDYSHIAINQEDLQYLVIFSTFFEPMAGKEVIINMINKPNDRTELWFFNDMSNAMTYVTYEQGIILMSNSIPTNNFCRSNYFEYVNGGYRMHSEFPDAEAGIVNPPFCGNVIAVCQEYKYYRLYSTLRFIPTVDTSNKLISLISTLY